MQIDRQTCDRARRSRDPRFDGRFFIAVTTTRVYCRPVCPVRAPKDEHVRYFATAAAAEAAGFRPCLRCHPEASPGTPAWAGTSSVVSRALRLIAEGALDGDEGVEQLAERLGMTARHLRRLFVQHLGATPHEVALTRRVHFAKKLLDETTLAVRDVAYASGFGSVRRFNSQIRRTFERTPTQLRRRAPQPAPPAGRYRFRLAYRPPYDWDTVLAFLRARATPGVELADDRRYRRTVQLDGCSGTIEVTQGAPAHALFVEVTFPSTQALLAIVERVRRVFDLSADPVAIAAHLDRDRLLTAPLAAHPGIRVPGAWDAFELAVRAILGQQVSVRAATTIAGRLAQTFGTPTSGADPALTRLFPTPAQLADAPLESVGIMPSRAATIRLLAGQVASGALSLGAAVDAESLAGSLAALPGIGPWTAGYIAMRALGAPDAFPHGDLVLRRVAGGLGARALDDRSQAWRPWRSYAVMLLWQHATENAGRIERNSNAEHVGSNRRGPGARRGLQPAARQSDRPRTPQRDRGDTVV